MANLPKIRRGQGAPSAAEPPAEARERLFVVHDNVFFNQKGDVICSGRGWTIRPM